MALFNVFQAENHLHIEIKWVGTGKECIAMGTKCIIIILYNTIIYSRRCVFCRTISLPSFNGLRCKLVKIALYIYIYIHDVILG